MPTWRQSLVGKVIGKSNQRALNPDFIHTKYFKAWSSFLHSEKLQRLVREYDYEVIFFPHANIQPYLDMFRLPGHIVALSHQEGSIQALFQRSTLMITDYSSVAFEMGMLQREVLYYHIKDFQEVPNS